MEIGPFKLSKYLQASFKYDEGALNGMVLYKMSGDRECEYKVQAEDSLSAILTRLKQEHNLEQTEVLLPGGHLMSKVVSQRPLTRFADII